MNPGGGGAEAKLDVERIFEVLDSHGVVYLLVGGIGARVLGAQRRTYDVDCLPRTDADNLRRLAAALRELGAKLRVGRTTDSEAAALPVHIDEVMLSRLEVSTWRTDAGDLDVLAGIPDRQGHRRRYDDLASNARTIAVGRLAVRVASLDDIIASKVFANRPKDREALPELEQLAARARQDAERSRDELH